MERTMVFRKKPEPKFDIPIGSILLVGTALFAAFLLLTWFLPGRFSPAVQLEITSIERELNDGRLSEAEIERRRDMLRDYYRQFPATGASEVREKIFDRGPMQFATLYVFWCSIAFCLFKFRQLQQLNTRGFGRQVEATIPRIIVPENATDVLTSVGSTGNFVFDYRVRKSLQILQDQRDAQTARVFLEKQTAADEEGAFRSYSFIRFAVWAMPILGFIGTVLGISIAVGGFASTLIGAPTVALIKTALQGVVSGLSVAFDTTLLALIATTIVMLAYTLFLRHEQQLLSTIDTLSRREIGARMVVYKAEVPPLDPARIEQALTNAIASVPQPPAVDVSAIQRVLGEQTQNFEGIQRAAREAGHEIAEAVVAKFQDAVAKIQAEHTTLAKQVAEQAAATFKQLMQEQAKQLRDEFKALNGIFERVQTIAESQRQAATLLNQLQGTQTDHLRRVHQSLQGVLPLLQGLSRGFQIAPLDPNAVIAQMQQPVPTYTPPAEALFSPATSVDDDPWSGASTLTDSKQIPRPFGTLNSPAPSASASDDGLDDWGETLEHWDESRETWDDVRAAAAGLHHMPPASPAPPPSSPVPDATPVTDLPVILPTGADALSSDPFAEADALFGEGGETRVIDPKKSKPRDRSN